MPSASKEKLARMMCLHCRKWHAAVECRHANTKNPLPADPPSLVSILLATIERLSANCLVWEMRAKGAVEAVGKINAMELHDLRQQLAEAKARNDVLEDTLKSAQPLNSQLETELRSAQQRVADQDSIIADLREQCNVAAANSATLSAQYDELKSSFTEMEAKLASSHDTIKMLQDEIDESVSAEDGLRGHLQTATGMIQLMLAFNDELGWNRLLFYLDDDERDFHCKNLHRAAHNLRELYPPDSLTEDDLQKVKDRSADFKRKQQMSRKAPPSAVT